MADFNKILDDLKGWGGKHLSFIKGFAALLGGVLFIYLSHRIFINVIVFSAGLLLIYYGLTELKLKKITDMIDKGIAKLRRRRQ